MSIPVHRRRMEAFLGRILNPHEFVHHINGNQNDNRLENLMVVTPKEHSHLHPRPRLFGKRQAIAPIGPPAVYVCLRCGAYFPTPARSKRRYCLACEKVLETEGWKNRKPRGDR